MYSLESRQVRRVWGMPGTATADMTLDVSNSGQYAVWAVPHAGEAYVFTVPSGDTGDLILKGNVPVAGWYPLVSTQDTFAAIYTRTMRADGVEIPAIQYIDLDALQVVPSMELNLEGWYSTIVERSLSQAASGSTVATSNAITGSRLPDVVLTEWLPPSDH